MNMSVDKSLAVEPRQSKMPWVTNTWSTILSTVVAALVLGGIVLYGDVQSLKGEAFQAGKANDTDKLEFNNRLESVEKAITANTGATIGLDTAVRDLAAVISRLSESTERRLESLEAQERNTGAKKF